MSIHKYPWMDDEISLIAANIEHPPRIVYKKYVEKFGSIRSFSAVLDRSETQRLSLIRSCQNMIWVEFSRMI